MLLPLWIMIYSGYCANMLGCMLADNTGQALLLSLSSAKVKYACYSSWPFEQIATFFKSTRQSWVIQYAHMHICIHTCINHTQTHSNSLAHTPHHLWQGSGQSWHISFWRNIQSHSSMWNVRVCLCVCVGLWNHCCEPGVLPWQVCVCPVGRVAGQRLFIEEVLQRERERDCLMRTGC